MTIKLIIVMEQFFCLLGSAAITIAIVLIVKDAYFDDWSSQATGATRVKINYFMYGLACAGVGGVLYMLWFSMCCWRLNVCKCQTRGNLGTMQREAWDLMKRLRDPHLIRWIQNDQYLGPEFDGLMTMIHSDTLESKKVRFEAEVTSDDVWIRQNDSTGKQATGVSTATDLGYSQPRHITDWDCPSFESTKV